MSKRLLIADDDQLFLNMLRLEFEKRDAPYQIITVEDGEHTIMLLNEHRPDMLVLDLRMPRLDGFGVLSYMQEHHTSIPVLVMTNYHDDEHRQKSEAFGVKQYIVKSEWKIGDLVEEIGKHLA